MNGCEYCLNEKIIIKDETISPMSWGWGGETKIRQSEVLEIEMAIFIDRGYLRFVNMDDCQCLDHGEKIKITFCPFCGNKQSKKT